MSRFRVSRSKAYMFHILFCWFRFLFVNFTCVLIVGFKEWHFLLFFSVESASGPEASGHGRASMASVWCERRGASLKFTSSKFPSPEPQMAWCEFTRSCILLLFVVLNPDPNFLRLGWNAMQVLGRLASQIAVVIQGKDKPTYSPNEDRGDVCVVLNAKDITLTGNKLTDKKYYWHTGYVESFLFIILWLQMSYTSICLSLSVTNGDQWFVFKCHSKFCVVCNPKRFGLS